MFDTVIGGHITLLFTVEKDGRLLRNQGSRGIGFNVDHGVSASVFETKTSQNLLKTSQNRTKPTKTNQNLQKTCQNHPQPNQNCPQTGQDPLKPDFILRMT